MNATARCLTGLITAAFLVLLAACGGSEDKSSSGGIAISGGAPTTVPAAPNTPVPSVNPTPTTEQVLLFSAFDRIKQLPQQVCPPGAAQSACVSMLNEPLSFTPPGKPVVTFVRMPQDLSKGIGIVRFATAPGGPSEVRSLARDASGAWKLFLRLDGPQPPPWFVQLPGDAVACSYNIMPARLLTEPSMTSNGPMLKDGDKLRLEEFRIESEGIVTPGRGFYRVSAPAAGWVYSDFVANALWDGCPSIR